MPQEASLCCLPIHPWLLEPLNVSWALLPALQQNSCLCLCHTFNKHYNCLTPQILNRHLNINQRSDSDCWAKQSTGKKESSYGCFTHTFSYIGRQNICTSIQSRFAYAGISVGSHRHMCLIKHGCAGKQAQRHRLFCALIIALDSTLIQCRCYLICIQMHIALWIRDTRENDP